MREIFTNFDFICGVLFIIMGIVYLVKTLITRKNAIRLSGEIIDFIWEKNACYPLIRFTYKGEEIKMQGGNGSSKPKGNVGEQVTVLYNPKELRYVNIVGNNNDIWVLAILVVFGVSCILKAFGK